MVVTPEEVGLSSPRLARVRAHLARYVDAGKVAGTLTLVARRGGVAYLEALGVMQSPARATSSEPPASTRGAAPPAPPSRSIPPRT